MAKTVVFESERISRWERTKRFVIPMIVLCVALIAAVAAALIIRGSRGETFTGGEDTPYPYSWTANKDGSVRLEIDRSASPDYVWSMSPESAGVELLLRESADADGENISLPVISATPDAKQKGDKSAFLLTPGTTGRAVLLLDLCHSSDEQDRIYEMTILIEVLEENGTPRADLIGVSGSERQGVTRGGQDSAYPYTVSQNDSGDLMIAVTDSEPVEGSDTAGAAEAGAENEEGSETVRATDTSWECSSDNENIALVLGVLYGENDVTAYVRAGAEPGRCTVHMYAESIGADIALELEVREDGTILVLSHGVTAAETAA